MNNKPRRSNPVQDQELRLINKALLSIKNLTSNPTWQRLTKNTELKNELAKKGIKPGSFAYRMKMRRQQLINNKKKAA
jgi:hypothetical protein